MAAGAFGAHGLESVLDNNSMATYRTAVDYQFYHTLAMGLTLLFNQHQSCRWLRYEAWLFLVGVLLFSGSLYGLALLSYKPLGMITPIGGVLFLAGWLSLLFGLWQLNRTNCAP